MITDSNEKFVTLLNSLGYHSPKFLSKGMQCLVYEVDNGRIVKVYGKGIGKDNLLRQKDFYDSLDLGHVSFKTPKIDRIVESDEHIFVEEGKLSGQCPTVDFLKSLEDTVMRTFLQHYVETLFSISGIKTNVLKSAEVLDLSGQFFAQKQYASWHDLITFNLHDKYRASQLIFDVNVVDIDNKLSTLSERVNGLIVTKPVLIHGDYFPANLLIDDSHEVTAVLDFGILTTVGDQRFDIATGWAFSDMYDKVTSFKIRDYTKALVFDRLTNQDRSAFYTYILVYSFISANMYGKNDPHDGHFSWCIANLNNDTYWAAI